MNPTIVYTCPVTKYMIEFIINNELKTAEFNTIICDYIHMKAWISLLRTSIDKLIGLKITKMRQGVSMEEWTDYLEDKTSWKIINIDKISGIYYIECPIDDFLENYGKAIGF